MEYGINLNSVIPLRAKPDDKSEMVSQILLGEKFVCQEFKKGFYKIINMSDQYAGWIDEKAITPISAEEFETLNKQSSYYVVIPLAEGFDLVNKCVIRIPGGSYLPNCDSIGRFGMHDKKFQIHRDFILPESELKKDGLYQTAISFINSPYMWGGKTVMGIDCSGFTQIVFGMHGYKLPRDAGEQVLQGEYVSLEDAQIGDLAFFQNDKEDVVHVGIIFDKNRIIHASGRVKTDILDSQGIYSEEYKKYTHKIHSVKRFEWGKSNMSQLNLWQNGKN